MKSLIKKILIEETKKSHIQETQEYLNHLLDKISDNGMESLSPKEKEDLIKLSRGESTEPEDFDEPTEHQEEFDRNKMFMHFAMEHEELAIGEKIYHAVIVDEMGSEHIEVTGPDVDFICSPFFEGREGIAIQTIQGQGLLLKVKEHPSNQKEMMNFVQKFYETYLPKIIIKVSSLEGLN